MFRSSCRPGSVNGQLVKVLWPLMPPCSAHAPRATTTTTLLSQPPVYSRPGRGVGSPLVPCDPSKQRPDVLTAPKVLAFTRPQPQQLGQHRKAVAVAPAMAALVSFS